MFADFILQQEMESAMSRIVSDAQTAYKVEVNDKYLKCYQKIISKSKSNSNSNYIVDRDKEIGEKQPYYEIKNGKIYRNGSSSPITGDNYLSDAYVDEVKSNLNWDEDKKILYIKIVGVSAQTKHRITLVTKIFIRG